MYKYLIIIVLILTFFIGCNKLNLEDVNKVLDEDVPQDTKLDMYKLNLQDDVYFLMGMDYALFQKILDNEAIDIYEQNSEVRMSEHYYQLKNGVGVNISYDHIISVELFIMMILWNI